MKALVKVIMPFAGIPHPSLPPRAIPAGGKLEMGKRGGHIDIDRFYFIITMPQNYTDAKKPKEGERSPGLWNEC
jgi:hypothetical protein